MDEMIKKQILSNIQTNNGILESDKIISQIEEAAQSVIKAYRNGKKVLLCGNGGSASDAQHIEGELVGRFQKERHGLPAIALTANTTTITAIGNDYGYSTIFKRAVEAHGVKGDVLIGFTTSGNSENIYEAFKFAKEMGIHTIGLLGKDGGKCKEIVDVAIVVPSDITARIQESHIMIGHILCSIVEEKLFG